MKGRSKSQDSSTRVFDGLTSSRRVFGANVNGYNGADFDLDGDTDFADYLILIANFGT